MKLNQSAFVQPHCLSPGVATGHIPFGAWLIETLKPRVFVDLGTFHGESYLAYCQTVSECNLRTRCFAVGPWRVADRPVEFLDDVFNTLERQNAAYGSFSRLVRAGYATVARQFEEGSIDLLQLPKEADFEALEELMALWQPKLSADAVVLVPDIDATSPSRTKFWEKFASGQANFEFKHNKGLGVYFSNATTKAALGLGDSTKQARIAEMLFDRLTLAIESQSAHEWTKLELHIAELNSEQSQGKVTVAEQAKAILENDIRALVTSHAATIARLNEDFETEKAAMTAQSELREREAGQLRDNIARLTDEKSALEINLSETRGKLAEMRVSLESALRNLDASETRRTELEASLARFWTRMGVSIDGVGTRLLGLTKLPARLPAPESAKRTRLTRYLIEPNKIGWRNANDA
jgi:O-antigen biosynthesis protein